jgi:hypothetical protein
VDGTGDDWGEGSSEPGSLPAVRTVTEPLELRHARLVLTLCERFGCLPSQLMEEDSELLYLMNIVEMGTPGG